MYAIVKIGIVSSFLLACAMGCARTDPTGPSGSNPAANAVGDRSIGFPSTGITVADQAILLAIDDVSLPLRHNACYYLSKPTLRQEAVLKPSSDPNAPDNLATTFYGTVLHDKGKFRMWYYAAHSGMNPDWPPRMKQQVAKQRPSMIMGPICYAESDDGITWKKPALGQVLFKGSRENNALALPHTVVAGVAVIRDDDETDPAKRYKMVYEYFPNRSDPPIEEFGKSPSVATATSPDGLRWTMVGMPFKGDYVEHCSFIKHNGWYIIHSHSFDKFAGGVRSEGGAKAGRVGVARLSSDFGTWPKYWCSAFALPEPADPNLRGSHGDYDQVHLGVGAASLGNVCVGLYGLWHNKPWDASSQKTCDLGLVVSNDGLQFREPVKGHVFISHKDSPAPAPKEADIPYDTALCQGNGIVNVGDETRIYYSRWRTVNLQSLAHHYSDIVMATLPRDRWGALGIVPGADEGLVCSAPVRLPAGPVSLAMNIDGAAGMAVDVLDERFAPVEGFSGTSAGRCVGGDGLDRPVRWTGGDLSALGGRTVRFQVRLTGTPKVQPRLYAMYVRAK